MCGPVSHLKQIFLSMIWTFTEGEGDGIEFRLPFKIFSTLTLAWTRFRIENDAWTFVLIRPLPCHLNRMTSESILNNSICEKKERIIFWWLCWLMQSQFQSVFLYVFFSENNYKVSSLWLDWIQNQFLGDFHMTFG